MEKMWMTTNRVLLVMLGALLFAAPMVLGVQKAQAEETLTIASIKSSGVLRVGTWLQYPPEMYIDKETGEEKGLWIDLARKMAADLDVKIEFIDNDWDGLIPGLQSNKFDIVLAQMSISAKRQLAVDFTKPWEVIGLSAIVKADSDCVTIECLNSPDKTISTILGSTSQPAKARLFPNAKETANKGRNDAFLEVLSGRSDAFITDNVSASSYMSEHPGTVKNPFDGIGQAYLETEPAAPAVAKGNGNSDFAIWIDFWLAEQINNGTYQTIYLNNIGVAAAVDELMLQRGQY